MTEEEREIYNRVYKHAHREVDKYTKEGSILKHYIHILEIILRLRQCCCHPTMFIPPSSCAPIDLLNSVGVEGVIQMKKLTSTECVVCLSLLSSFAFQPTCKHSICSDCFGKNK